MLHKPISSPAPHDVKSNNFVNPILKPENMDLYLVRSSIMQALQEFLPHCKGVFLDIGCGEMPYKSLILKKNGITNYIGMDIENPKYQKNVKPDIFWNGTCIPLQDKFVDCAMATELFEHLPSIEVVLKEVKRVLKPGGMLFFTVPFLWPLHDNPHDEYRYTPFSLKRHLLNAGFANIKIEALGGWDASLAQMIGLWVTRRPMTAERRREFIELLYPFYEELIATERKDGALVYDDMLKNSVMITGLCGIVAKPCEMDEGDSIHERHQKDSTQIVCGGIMAPKNKTVKEKVVIITDQFPVLSQTFILAQITGLVDRNVNVENWTLEIMHTGVVHSKVNEYDLYNKTRLIRLPADQLRASAELWVQEFKKINGFDNLDDILAFHVHFGPNFNRFEPLFRVSSKFVVVSFHGYDGSATIQIHGGAVYRYLFQRADVITTPSHYMKAALVKAGCIPDKIRVHRYGVDVNRFTPTTKDSDAKDVVLLTVARFVEKKGLEYALQAFARLPAGVNATYRLIGDGPLRSALQIMAGRLGIQDRVVFLGAQPQDVVQKEMAASDIFVLTSITAQNGDQEGVPVCLIEAQAMGLPVISSQHAGIPELIIKDMSGFLAEEKNIVQISAYMQTLVTDKSIRERFGSNARKRILEEFNIESLNNELARLLERNYTDKTKPVNQEKITDRAVQCPICEGRFPQFKPFGVHPRPNALCPTCHSLERHRLLWLYLQQRTNFFKDKIKVLEVAPSEGLSKKIQELPNVDYVSIDLNSPLAMQQMDITSLAFPDHHFDCIFCYHVLEHIPDDHKAMTELRRVLKPSGWAIIQVPLDERLEKTIEDPSISDPQERKRLFGREDHVRYYGRDYKDRLEKAGFIVNADDFAKTLSSEEILTFALMKNETIYRCRSKQIVERTPDTRAKKNTPKIVFAVTETGDMSSAGDYFTAMELGLACREQFGWDVELLPKQRWYDVADADVLVAMVHEYDLTRLGPRAVNIMKICWMRNWFDGWARQRFFHLWDVYLCSSRKASDHLIAKYKITTHLLRIATNPRRFKPLNQERKTDYCFTGNYWNDPRDIEKIDPVKIGLNFSLFGKNWERHAQFKRYYKGFIPYSDLPSIYNQAKILVDDANSVTKEWGSVNSRVFDALAAGTLVITNSEESSKDAFHGQLPVYKTPDELQKMLHLFTGNVQAYENKISMLRTMVLEEHTYDVRALEFKDILLMHSSKKLGVDIESSNNGLLKIKPRISIIIPVFNKLNYTEKCLSALKENTPPDICEIIIVDNASMDGTARYLASLNEPSMKIMRNNKNKGFAKACNQGAAAASGNYLLFLNNDTEVRKGWLEPLISVLDADTAVVAVGSKMLYPDGTIQHAGVMIVDDRPNKTPLSPWHIHYHQSGDLPDANQASTYQALTAACLLLRKQAFQQVDGFDELYWNGYEDVDLCFKFHTRGWKLVYQPLSVVTHYESKSGPERRTQEQQNLARLQQLWRGKIHADFIRDRDNRFVPAAAKSIRAYPATTACSAASTNVQNGTASIVILTFNSAKTIVNCLQSVVNTIRPCDEVFIVDNASTDNTVEKVVALIRGRSQCRMIRSEKNLGFSAGTNVGIRAALNPFVVLLNPDTIVSTGWLEHLLAHFNDPLTGAVGPISDYVAGRQKMSLYQQGPFPKDAKINDLAQMIYQWNTGKSIETKLLIGFCMAVRRDLLQLLGPLDENLFLGNDDLELSWRLRVKGYRLKVATDVFIHHEGQQSFNTVKKETTSRLVQESTDALFIKLQSHYGENRVPTPGELWDIEWFTPTNACFNPKAKITDSYNASTLNAKHHQPDLVSIIILTFNELRYTKECVESVQKHTPEPHEIIFVDNASTDGTVKWLKQLVNKNVNYKLIENEKNHGFSKGCNQGIDASSGEYIVLLNNDVVVTENWLSGMLECLQRAPDTGIVGPMTNSISGPQKVGHVEYSSIEKLDTYARGFRERNRHRIIPLRRIVGFCMLFRGSLVDKIGLLDESFGSGNFEDDDYCLRATLLDYRNVVAGDVFIHHYGSRSFVGNAMDFSASLSGNRKIFAEKWSGIDQQSALGKKLIVVTALDRAWDFHHRGQADEAATTLLEGIKHSPDDRSLYYLLAEFLMDSNLFKDAIDVLNQLPQDDSDVRKITLMGYCKEGLELYEDAGTLAKQALFLNGSSAAALNLSGILEFKQGDRNRAESFFHKAIETNPGYGEPYTNLGVLKWAAEQHEDALTLLERGFTLSPLVMDIVTTYHTAVSASRSFARAESAFRAAKVLYPLNKRIAFLLIDVLLQQEQFDQAMNEVEQAISTFGIDDGILSAALNIRSKIMPGHVDRPSRTRHSLSLCMIVKNEERHLPKCLMSVKALVDEMVIIDTGSSDRTRDIATAFGAQVYDFPWTGDFDKARNFSLSKAGGDWILILDADEVLSPNDHPALLRLIAKQGAAPVSYSFVSRNYILPTYTAGWTANDGKYAREEAGTGWIPSSKVRLFPRDSRIRFENPVHELVEPSLRKNGIPIKICDIPVHHYGKLDPQKYTFKGEEYYLLGRKKLEEMGENADALRELAIQAAELKKYDESIELWRRALNLQPDMVLAYVSMASAYLELGNYSEALASSIKSFALAPDMKEAVYNYALCELYAGNVARTIEVLEDLETKISDYPSAKILLVLAYCCDRNKAKGVDLFWKLQKMNIKFAESVHKLGRKLVAAGRIDYAVALLDMAIETNNVNDDILNLREACRTTMVNH